MNVTQPMIATTKKLMIEIGHGLNRLEQEVWEAFIG